MEPIITAKGIGKKYNITHQRGGYVALRDVITNAFKNPLSFLKRKTKEIVGLEKKEIFWALKDINFEIKKGEVVGIIGKNGAGKSTLLKILSQITPPTEGEIRINGTVGSLLEVGTGFHPELTGRENIFLNGAILGIKKKDIEEKFNEIVEFAGIEKFLDTPVKYYSSGMYVRLAFSVAAHMDTDILIIDEVLAVGDAEFQKKCLGKMEDITKKEGRTILFVSHNMGAIEQLCKRCIMIEKGEISEIGSTEKIIDIYLKNVNKNQNIPLIERKDRTGSGIIKINNIEISNDSGNKSIKSFDKLNIKVTTNKKINSFSSIRLILGFYDTQSRPLFRIDTDFMKKEFDTNNNFFIFNTGPINITPQLCTVNIALLVDEKISDYIINAYYFEISESSKKDVYTFKKDLATILIETKYNT